MIRNTRKQPAVSNFYYPLLLLFYFGLIGMNQAQDYYRSLSFTHSPLHAMKGAKSNSFHDTVALYQITMKDGRMQSLIYQLNGSPKPIYENYTASTFVWAAQNLFEYNKEEIRIRHLDYRGMPVTNKPALSVYQLDEDGRAVNLKYFDQHGAATALNGIHEYQWEYMGEQIGEIRYDTQKEIKPMNNWFPYTWVLLQFDESRNLTSITTTDENWQTSSEAVQIDFDIAKHEIIGWGAKKVRTNSPSNETGPRVVAAKHDFDANGYLIRTRFFDREGNRAVSAWGHMGFVRIYNEQGNRLSYNFIDEHDNITLAPDRGYSGQKFLWDEEGRFRLHTCYVDLAGAPIVRETAGYAQIQFIYGLNGVEVGRIFKDAAGQLSCNGKQKSYLWLQDTRGARTRKELCN